MSAKSLVHKVLSGPDRKGFHIHGREMLCSYCSPLQVCEALRKRFKCLVPVIGVDRQEIIKDMHCPMYVGRLRTLIDNLVGKAMEI